LTYLYFEDAMEEIANYFSDISVVPEAKERVSAFLEKRMPKF